MPGSREQTAPKALKEPARIQVAAPGKPQRELFNRARCNGAARWGKYSSLMEAPKF